MNWNLPSLTTLRILEAAARHKSFTRAAMELNITQSAVSRQIRILEEYFNIRLFNREQHCVTLTAAGEHYLEHIRGPLEQIQKATVDLVADHSGAGILSVATPPAFGTRWLIPRLPKFQQAHPEILISLVTRNGVFDFSTDDIDAAFHYGNNDWPDVVRVHLAGHDNILVGAPAYLSSLPPIRCPQDVAAAVKLQPLRRPNLWRDWMQENGVAAANPWAGPRFEHYYMIIQAAVAGIGLALLPRLIVADELRSGRLANPLEREYLTADCYSLVYPKSRESDPKLATFLDWLKVETVLP